MQDLLVIGLDLATGRDVHIDDAPVPYWRSIGHHAAETLVCALCHAGIDVPEPISVPLVVRGRIGGVRRAHLAHPPHRAPAGGHSPESVWHLTAKTTLAAWTARQPGVVRVDVECWTPDRCRRTDVRIQFEDGREVALEVQATRLIDQQWLDRHDAYRRHGIVDVWLWRPGTSPHWVVPAEGEHLWELDPVEQRAWLLLGAGHERAGRWWAQPDRRRYAPHVPPCVNDRLLRYPVSLTDLAATARGLVVPAELLGQIADAATTWTRTPSASAIRKPRPPLVRSGSEKGTSAMTNGANQLRPDRPNARSGVARVVGNGLDTRPMRSLVVVDAAMTGCAGPSRASWGARDVVTGSTPSISPKAATRAADVPAQRPPM